MVVMIKLQPQLFSQSDCLNNPSLQAGNISPAPLMENQNGTLQFTYNHGGREYNDYTSKPLEISICFANIEPIDSLNAIYGTIAPKFTWSLNSAGCLIGVQNQPLANNDGGTILIDFRPMSFISCPENKMGFIANLQPPQCMNSTDLKSDNSESVFTCAKRKRVAFTNPHIMYRKNNK